MASDSLRAEGGSGGAISAFLAWWRRELAALTPSPPPAWTREPTFLRIERSAEGEVAVLYRRGRRREKQVRRLALDGSAVLTPDLLERAPRSGPVLRLAPEQTLSRRVSPPRAAEPRLEAVLRHDLASQMPFGPEEAYYDFRVLERGVETLDVELFCIGRAKLDRWRAALAAHGLAPVAVTVEAPTRKRAHARRPIDLLRGLKQRRWAAGASRRFALAALTLALLVAAIWLPYQARRAQNLALEQEVAGLSREARTATALEEEIARISERDARLSEILAAPAPRLAILAAATEALPDSAWLRRLEIEGTTARLDGEAAEAAPLIAALEASPAFEGARFLAPVIGSQGGGERFSIGVTLVAPEQGER